MFAQTRACNEVHYTKTHAKNVDSGNALGGGYPSETVDFEVKGELEKWGPS